MRKRIPTYELYGEETDQSLISGCIARRSIRVPACTILRYRCIATIISSSFFMWKAAPEM
ncbi:hypothetical protein H721_02705 [Brucella ovis IntaBari-2006-46-332]|nr:hypothetical protein C010_02872 [Brucella ovis 80/125]ENR05867.1 hypothetical protein C961_02572 [Brucella ovis F8/05B]ENS92252.1 hypothetical protein B999_02839 [Brucella ovis 63/96]ENS95764.1 hypothetical protein C009_02720 [Brucella ovis 81/8]ENT75546.1 hypothetical protein H712_02849 [Brucella ovis IntaBari-2009-88-4]ENT77547.1 hypothetical protein H720_02635 [Brucella ovis IntaBari-2006-46-348]ENT80996.1 hypothetical protein H713_02855 [Brucella ovis IntaBari-2010-47-268]ENT85589.1 h